MMAISIKMKDGMRADSLIALKIDGTAARINGTAGKIDGIAKRMFANSKEINVSIEGMCPAAEQGPDVAKIISLCS